MDNSTYVYALYEVNEGNEYLFAIFATRKAAEWEARDIRAMQAEVSSVQLA